jgi:hypothetical protein
MLCGGLDSAFPAPEKQPGSVLFPTLAMTPVVAPIFAPSADLEQATRAAAFNFSAPIIS